MMIPRRIHWSVYIFVAFGIIGYALYHSIPAHADPIRNYATDADAALCAALDDNPTIAGVGNVIKNIKTASGFTDFQAGATLFVAVVDSCPRYLPLLQQYAENNTERTVTV